MLFAPSTRKLVSTLLVFVFCLVFLRAGSASEPLVSINSASAIELAQSLSGIGPVKAQAIVSYREQHGPFESLDQLVKVKGIGPRTLEKIRAQLNVKVETGMKPERNVLVTSASKVAVTQENMEALTRQAVRTVIDSARRSHATRVP